jgi:hypothetical protein
MSDIDVSFRERLVGREKVLAELQENYFQFAFLGYS